MFAFDLRCVVKFTRFSMLFSWEIKMWKNGCQPLMIFCRCSLLKTEPQGLEGLVTIRQDVLSSIKLSRCCRSTSHDFSGYKQHHRIVIVHLVCQMVRNSSIWISKLVCDREGIANTRIRRSYFNGRNLQTWHLTKVEGTYKWITAVLQQINALSYFLLWVIPVNDEF